MTHKSAQGDVAEKDGTGYISLVIRNTDLVQARIEGQNQILQSFVAVTDQRYAGTEGDEFLQKEGEGRVPRDQSPEEPIHLFDLLFGELWGMMNAPYILDRNVHGSRRIVMMLGFYGPQGLDDGSVDVPTHGLRNKAHRGQAYRRIRPVIG